MSYEFPETIQEYEMHAFDELMQFLGSLTPDERKCPYNVMINRVIDRLFDTQTENKGEG